MDAYNWYFTMLNRTVAPSGAAGPIVSFSDDDAMTSNGQDLISLLHGVPWLDRSQIHICISNTSNIEYCLLTYAKVYIYT